MSWRFLYGVLGIVSWNVVISSAVTIDMLDTSSNCPKNCSCPLLYRADCRNRPFEPPGGDRFSESSSKLLSLWLDRNAIEAVDPNAFRDMEKLRHLSLSQNYLTHLPKNIFSNLKKLIVLDLSNNKLQCLDSNLFKPFGKLKKLNLSFNKLKVIDDKLLIPLQSIDELNLSNNPFDCTKCILRGAIEWTKGKKDTQATCMAPNPGVSWSNYEFIHCSGSYDNLDPTDYCYQHVNDFSPLGPRSAKTEPLWPVILAISFGVTLVVIILGIVMYCCISKHCKRQTTVQERNEYDDIRPEQYDLYESIGRVDLIDLRYVSFTSSSSVPDLPRRGSKPYDDIYVKGQMRGSTSYIEPTLPDSLKNSLNSFKEGSFQIPQIKTSTEPEENSYSSKKDEEKHVFENNWLVPNSSKPISEENLVVRASGQSKGGDSSPQFIWDRESFWNT